jgi:phosphoserine phosphatase RsbU/P
VVQRVRRRERDQAREQLVRELEDELQTAYELQMGLMPAEPPQLEGLDIAGRCSPATHVGGDFFQYYSQDGKLSICMADVTGHAMAAAVPVMMFSGVLESEMKQGESLVDLFANLTQTLHKRLDKRTFVCFTMGSLDTDTRILRLANGGCPYPYHFRAATGEVAEVEVDGFPLGVSAEADYSMAEIQLEAGDRIVFCSDGIIEAWNARQEMFGYERTAAAIEQGCRQNLSASHLLNHLIGQAHAFTGETPQEDDQTVVVLAVAT